MTDRYTDLITGKPLESWAQQAMDEREAMTTPTDREAIARVLWERMRERLRGHRGRRIMPMWSEALPEERELYLSDADAIRALRPAPASDVERALDWTKPLEAYHPNGEVRPITKLLPDYHDDFPHEQAVDDDFIGNWNTFYLNGSNTDPDKNPWRIRNVLALTAAPSVQDDDGVVAALEPFANLGDLIELETTGFDDTDELSLIVEDGHLLDRFTVGDFRRARAALAQRKGGGS